MIYKYYSLTSYNLDALKVGYFYFSKAKYLNDPFDTSFKLVSQSIVNRFFPKEPYKTKGSKSMANYGICSFSEQWDNNILWAYYADNYKGFVVGYDEKVFTKIMENYLVRIPFQKVHYIKNLECIYNQKCFPYYSLGNEEGVDAKFEECQMPSLGTQINIKALDKFFTYLCAVKSSLWQSEKEWRLIAAKDVICGENSAIIKEDTGYKIPMPQGCIKEIIIGFNFDKKHSGDINEIMVRHNLSDVYCIQTAQSPFGLEKVKYNLNKLIL